MCFRLPSFNVLRCILAKIALFIYRKYSCSSAISTFEHFKALSQGCHASALADHVISTGHNIKWDYFDILTTGKSDLQCKIKETLLISELKPSLNENVGSEKLFLY